MVIGAGPVGLAAAAHLAERGVEFLVLESGTSAAAAIDEWRHVRLFSPWRYDMDAAARRFLERSGWLAPDPDQLPTGGDLVDGYLAPLAQDPPELADRIRYGAEGSRSPALGFDRLSNGGRGTSPAASSHLPGPPRRRRRAARRRRDRRRLDLAIPNVLGASGIPARGEAAELLVPALPDVLGADLARFAGRRTAVVGAGHSAATTLLALAELARDRRSPGWSGGARHHVPSLRRRRCRRAAGPRRARRRLRRLVRSGRVTLLSGFRIQAVGRSADGRSSSSPAT